MCCSFSPCWCLLWSVTRPGSPTWRARSTASSTTRTRRVSSPTQSLSSPSSPPLGSWLANTSLIRCQASSRGNILYSQISRSQVNNQIESSVGKLGLTTDLTWYDPIYLITMKDSGLLLTFSPSSWWSMSGIRAENLSQVNILDCANKCITSPASDKMNYVIHRHYLDPTLDTPDPAGFGQGSVRAAILCSFLSIYAWVSSSRLLKRKQWWH